MQALRHRVPWLTTTLVVLALMATSCSTSDSTPSVGELTYADPGPYEIARATVELVDPSRDDRRLTVDVWYPTTGGDDAGLSSYTLLPGVELASDLARDGGALDGGGPWPLAVYSHGYGGVRFASSFLTEHLATHGFVVAAPDHAGNTATDVFVGGGDPRSTIEVDRPLDISFVISSLLAGGADDTVAGLGAGIDAERIGVFGHSFGGYTSLAAVSGHTGVTPDARIDATVAMAPFVDPMPDAELGAVDVPVLVVSGTADTTTTIEAHTERVWELVTGRPAHRVDIVAAGHQSFTDVCTYLDVAAADPDVPEALENLLVEFAEGGCTDGFIPIGRAHDLINHHVTAFLLDEVAGDGAAGDVVDELVADAPDDAVVAVHSD